MRLGLNLFRVRVLWCSTIVFMFLGLGFSTIVFRLRVLFLGLGFSTIVFRFRVYVFRVRIFNLCV